MKVIIAGSREISDLAIVARAIQQSGFDVTEIVSGHARGVYTMGELYALDQNIKLRVFHAHWRDYEAKAGILRNHEMAEYVDALIAVWDGESRGTAHMIETMLFKGKPVFTFYSFPSGNRISCSWANTKGILICQARQNGLVKSKENCGASCTETECRVQ